MDPVQAAIAPLLTALQGAAADSPPVQLAALKALIGQEVNVLFLGATPDGQQLALPSGQVITAQGSLSYPEGTQLLMRVLGGDPGTGNLRLQTLTAQPPQASAILAPLLQGEGASLLVRLGQPDPSAALAPLAELYQFLKGEATPLQAALDALPPASLAALQAALNVPADTSPAEALAKVLADGSAQLPASRVLLQELAQLLQTTLDRHPDLPQAPKDTLAAVVKLLLGSAPEVAERKAVPLPAPAKDPDSPAEQLRIVLAGRPGAAPEAPETWESWIKTSVKTLSDPAASPREAPFHAAQAKEGTAFYEIPLPWTPQSPMQMWVESDQEHKDRGSPQETRTVLIGLKFTRLGETRLGIAKGPAGLQVRVWTEHPELLAATREQVETELKELSVAVDLRILPLQPGPGGFVPSLRSLVTGPSVQVLG